MLLERKDSCGRMDDIPLEIRDLDGEVRNDYSNNGLKILTKLGRDRYSGDVKVDVNTIYFEGEHDSKVHIVRDLDDSIDWLGVGPTDDRNRNGNKKYAVLDFFLTKSKSTENNYIFSMDEEIGEELGYDLKLLKEMEDFERREVMDSFGMKRSRLTVKYSKIPFFIERRGEKRRTTDDDLDFVRDVLEEYKREDREKYENRIKTLDISLSGSCALTCRNCEECKLLFNKLN